MEKYYSLLYVSLDSDGDGINSGNVSKEDMYFTYIGNSVLLNKSLRFFSGKTLNIITNRSEFLSQILKSFNAEDRPLLLQIDFSSIPPFNIPFYSAHFKLDAFGYLGLSNCYSILLDLDTVFIRPISESVSKVIRSGIPIVYDISDQIDTNIGLTRCASDIELVSGVQSFGLWRGGELIGGTGDFFSRLHTKCLACSETYYANLNNLHHIGDEMLTNAALVLLENEGVSLMDIGRLSLIGRYWSGVPNFFQRNVNWFLRNLSILHLPQDKKFLSKNSGRKFNAIELIFRYRIYCAFRLIRNLLIAIQRHVF